MLREDSVPISVAGVSPSCLRVRVLAWGLCRAFSFCSSPCSPQLAPMGHKAQSRSHPPRLTRT
eukprot:4342015-Alexandrium_andersonii.AAC.1